MSTCVVCYLEASPTAGICCRANTLGANGGGGGGGGGGGSVGHLVCRGCVQPLVQMNLDPRRLAVTRGAIPCPDPK